MRRQLASLVVVLAVGCAGAVEDTDTPTSEDTEEVRGSRRRDAGVRDAGSGSAAADAGGPRVLVGNTTIEPMEDYETVGDADAFEYMSGAQAGKASKIILYAAASNRATALQVALYGDNGGVPGALLAGSSCTISMPAGVAGWFGCALSNGPVLSANTKYWMAALSTSGEFRWRAQDGSHGKYSYSAHRTSLAATWTQTGTYFGYARSAYVEGIAMGDVGAPDAGSGSAPADAGMVPDAASSGPADCGTSGTVLFQERFEDSNLSGRGWYDNSNPVLSSAQASSGSTRSAEFRFLAGATKPTNGGAMRKKFSETDSVYLSYYVKYSANWQGSNRAYHPHEFYFLTNQDSDWSGLAFTHLTAYVEQNEGVPMVAIQDGVNIDQSRIGQNLTATTELRGVAGCNGDSDGYGNGDCYNAGSYVNGKSWKAPQVYFSDAAGPTYKADWHHVEAFLKLNSVASGKGIADGAIQYWYDGQLVLDHRGVMFRTGQHPDMKFNQLIIAPWIGDGSPVDQTFWVDELTVATGRTGGSCSVTPTTRSVSLAWDAPLTNSDGTPLTDLGGYRLHYGTSSRSYSVHREVPAATTTLLIDGLAPGTYYFAASAVNAAGVESDLSSELRVDLP
ncbi:MAG: hypothetical protein HY901_05425 [Deltaproteobacteria bacterium]|nr:hypothetical protein [Deltaproteobacteria bacterium]